MIFALKIKLDRKAIVYEALISKRECLKTGNDICAVILVVNYSRFEAQSIDRICARRFEGF